MLAYPNVLLFADDEREARELQQLLSPYARLTCAQTLAELGQMLKSREYDALFCTEFPRTGTWGDVIPEIHKSHPDLPVIILSRSAAGHDWRELLDAGAFDLLAPPYRETTLMGVLEQATASRQALAWHSARTLRKETA